MISIGRTIAATAVIASSACMSTRSRPAFEADAPFVLSGSAFRDSSYLVSRTNSFALDRITKREPRLDSLVRRTGTGAGVAIYVFDGGVNEEHPELAGRVRVGFDAFPSNPRACNAHGTAVAGAAAGATLGVAPDAEIVDVKIINCARLRGSVSSILAAARWTADDHARHPGQPAVANWSFAVDTARTIPEVDSAVAILHDAGILVVVSAGNYDIDACRVSPANSARAFVVGATALARSSDGKAVRDVRASSTAWGSCIDVYAPGDSVRLPSVDHGELTVATWNGTSMAAGYVSGAAALVLERDRVASPEEVSAALLANATPIHLDDRRTSSGFAKLLFVGPAPSVRTIASASHKRH